MGAKRHGMAVVSRNIKRFREARGLSAEELARRAGLSSVKMIESGRNIGRVQTLAAIAEALDVTIGDLFVDYDAAPPDELRRFLESPNNDNATPQEVALLKALHIPGRAPTVDAYYWELKKIRAMPTKWAAKPPSEASTGTATRGRRIGGGSGGGT